MVINDIAMLLSFVNTKLRDEYTDFAEMCEDLQLSADEVEEKLGAAGWVYDPDRNQFV